MSAFSTVDEYVASFPDDARPFLERVVRIVREELPDATEKIRYDMAAFLLAGREGVHVAGWKKHVGLYPVPRFDAARHGDLEADVAPYRAAKDTVQLRYRDGVPEELLRRVLRAVSGRHDGPGD